MNIGAVSDTHNQLYSVSPVKLLVHAGDLTIHGSKEELEEAIKQMLAQPAEYRVAVAGNHDRYCETNNEEARKLFKDAGIIYLQDEEVTIEGLRIYGSPYTPEYGEYAFNLSRFDYSLEEKWEQVPTGIDILVTHGPPWGKFDVPFGENRRVGCTALMRELIRIKPRVHIFGHVHSPGEVRSPDDGILYINAASCNIAGGRYNRVYDPVTFELEPRCQA